MKFPWNRSTPASGQEKQPSSAAVIEQMLANAAACLNQGNSDRAFETYMEIVKLTPNAPAQYNLGALYAVGQGTEQNLLQEIGRAHV